MNRASQPLMGMTTALATRYEVSTQVTSSWPADRLPRMWSRATLATEVSRISMRVGIITEAVMSHLLTSRAAMVRVFLCCRSVRERSARPG